MMSFSCYFKIIISKLQKSISKLFGILMLLYVCKTMISQKGGTYMRTIMQAVIRVRRIKIGLTPEQWDQLTTAEQAEIWASSVNEFIANSLRADTTRPKRFNPYDHVPSAQITSEIGGCVTLFHLIGTFEIVKTSTDEVES